MDPLQELFLVLLAIYGSECLWWVPQGASAFVAPLGARFRLRRPFPLVQDGVLPGYRYNGYSAAVEGRESTGHAGGGARSVPTAS